MTTRESTHQSGAHLRRELGPPPCPTTERGQAWSEGSAIIDADHVDLLGDRRLDLY